MVGTHGRARLRCAGPGLTVNLGQARALAGPGKALQGNIDPMVLMAGPEAIGQEVAHCLQSFAAPELVKAQGAGAALAPTHIFNLGHGISQHTPPENVAVLVDEVHAQSRKMRNK